MVGFSKRGYSKWIILGCVLLFFYIPILTLMLFSFNDSKSLVNFTGFSMQWYETVFNSRDMISAIQTSLSIAVISTLISTIVGTIAAVGLSRSRKVIREIVINVSNLPILNPDIVTAIGLMLLFVSLGIKSGYGTMLIAHIAFSTPYVIFAILPKIRTLDSNLVDAAMDLGATPFKALTKVILPQITPSIISGALIAFSMSFDDFVISYFVSGDGVKNISMVVWSMSKRFTPAVNALSTLVIVVITIGLILINVIPMLRERKIKKVKGDY